MKGQNLNHRLYPIEIFQYINCLIIIITIICTRKQLGDLALSANQKEKEKEKNNRVHGISKS